MLCDGVAGQSRARAFFARVLGGGRLAHAYLLVGPPGVGKRRFAEELAAALLCERRDRPAGDAGACRECRACRLAAGSNHPALQILEPGASGAIEIDRVRGACAALALRGAGVRILVIDGAERLTAAAANAFLKTLEEPAAGVLFLLVTSTPEHLLPTIRSRCQRVPFVPLSTEELAAALAGVEGVGEPPIPLADLQRRCSGSPGRALELLRAWEGCGVERLTALLEGEQAIAPEALLDLVAAEGNETERDRVRRLLDLICAGIWAARGEKPQAREAAAHRAIEVAELAALLDERANHQLLVEELARLLAAGARRGAARAE